MRRRTARSPTRLDGMPVVCCSLHSQLAPVCAALAGRRVVYVQLEGGALPAALSDTVRDLKERRLVEAVATVGPCFGGDVECVSAWSALAWAKAQGLEVAVCAIGPGHRRHRHAARPRRDSRRPPRRTQRSPSAAGRSSPPASPTQTRESGTAASPTTRGPCSTSSGRRRPSERTAEGWEEACAGLPLSHMGRGPDEDPAFFAAAFAAGRLAAAARLVEPARKPRSTDVRPGDARCYCRRIVVDPSVISTSLPRSERDILVHGTAAQAEFENACSAERASSLPRLGRRRRRARTSTPGSHLPGPDRDRHPGDASRSPRTRRSRT